MKKHLFCTLFLFFTAYSSWAINVGEVTSIIVSDQSNLAKEIENTTDAARFVSVSVHRLSSPMADGKIIPMDRDGELLSTPANVVLPGNAKDVFRFIYNGPDDDKERYYRLSWVDEPVNDVSEGNNTKVGLATTSVEINTILVVAPRQPRFNYAQRANQIINTGNVSFRVISYGPCKDPSKEEGQGCRERYYVMPDEDVHLKHTNVNHSKTRIGIWHENNYIQVK